MDWRMETDADKAHADLAAALWTAVRAASSSGPSLAPLAAALGARRATDQQSVAMVLNELEVLESDMLQRQSELATDARATSDDQCMQTIGRIHRMCAAARQDALRAFARTARHDAVNAIGAARNAVVLLAEGINTGNHQRLVDIAKRNLQLAERLVRGQFAEDESPDHDASPAPVGLRGDQGQNLRGARERDHLDTRGA
jgi:hypothetical protein